MAFDTSGIPEEKPSKSFDSRANQTVELKGFEPSTSALRRNESSAPRTLNRRASRQILVSLHLWLHQFAESSQCDMVELLIEVITKALSEKDRGRLARVVESSGWLVFDDDKQSNSPNAKPTEVCREMEGTVRQGLSR